MSNTLPPVLGDSLAAGLSKQVNRDIERSILRRLEQRSFRPPSRRFGCVKRARLDWLRGAGALFVHTNETKRQMLSLWLIPQHDGGWCELADLIVAGQNPMLANARVAITQHAAQRLLQARVSIEAAARVRRDALYLQPAAFYEREGARTFEPTGEYASTHGLWRFDAGVLVTFIPLRVLDPPVLERHQRGLEASGWVLR